MHVAGLFIHPVKSLRALSVSRVELDALGFAGDRGFMVVDETGRFLTQRTLPRMALIDTMLTADSLAVAIPGMTKIEIARASDALAPLLIVSIWRSERLQAEDCGDAVATQLTRFLGVQCRLVRAGRRFNRPMTKPTAAPADRIGFVDADPLLVISEASLGELNDRLLKRGEDRVPMNRFRPNIVIHGSAPFAEHSWPRLRIGDVVLRAGDPCARCIVTTTDQLTGERGKEPLRTLGTYRRDPTDPSNINFGHNFINESKTGVLELGASVEVMSG
jgi:uncharacterized protein YcbX